MLTTPHRDVKDPPNGWVGILVVGSYTEGHLCIPELGIALPYQSGDVVYMRSWMLIHFITKYCGIQRYVILFATIKRTSGPFCCYSFLNRGERIRMSKLCQTKAGLMRY